MTKLTPELKKFIKEGEAHILWGIVAGSDYQKEEPEAYLLLSQLREILSQFGETLYQFGDERSVSIRLHIHHVLQERVSVDMQMQGDVSATFHQELHDFLESYAAQDITLIGNTGSFRWGCTDIREFIEDWPSR